MTNNKILERWSLAVIFKDGKATMGATVRWSENGQYRGVRNGTLKQLVCILEPSVGNIWRSRPLAAMITEAVSL